MTLVRLLYRDLLQIAKVFDKDVALRSMISAQMLQRVTEKDEQRPHVLHFNRCLVEYLEHRSFWWPQTTQKSLADFIREKFREDRAGHRSIDASFLALRALHDQVDHAKQLGLDLDTPASQTTSTEPLSVVEAERLSSGVFLLAHPLTRDIFSRSVILLVEHTQKGTKGVIVNHPSKDSVMRSFRVPPEVMESMGGNKVHHGGPVPSQHAEVLHRFEEFGGQPIRSSNFGSVDQDCLFFGADILAAASAVKEERVKASEITWIRGISGWSPGQLENELRRGAWIAVRAPLSTAINAKRDLWERMMDGLGGEFVELKRIPDLGALEYDDEEL